MNTPRDPLAAGLRRRDCLALLTLAPLGHATAGSQAASDRPAHWAQPLELSGVRNLHRVTEHLYRSEQPKARGMAELERLGIRTVINLRAFHTDRDEIRGTGLLNHHLRINTWAVEDEHVTAVLRFLRVREKGPFLIHCQHGADRTGLMCAMYRMVEQDWTREEAIREMTQGGYGFHSVWRNILKYLQGTDVAKIRRALDAPQALNHVEVPPCARPNERGRVACPRLDTHAPT